MKPNYNDSYYRTLASSSTSSAGVVVPLILDYVKPVSVVDVGCGIGAWLAEFCKHNVNDILGLDGAWVDARLLTIPREHFQVVDLAQAITVPRRFDLAVSLETAEHLPPDSATAFVDSLTRLSSVIVFSAAIPFQGGHHHVNEQWPEYWAKLFDERGYTFVDCLRPRVWNNPAVEWWYAQNLFFVVERARLTEFPALHSASSQTRLEQLAIVHPRAYLANAARAKRPAELFQATLGAIKRSLQHRLSK